MSRGCGTYVQGGTFLIGLVAYVPVSSCVNMSLHFSIRIALMMTRVVFIA